MSRKTVYVLQSSKADERPTVWIESLKDGTITFGLKASGSSLRLARDRAQKEWTELKRFVEEKR